jgi:hypothetical protein
MTLHKHIKGIYIGRPYPCNIIIILQSYIYIYIYIYILWIQSEMFITNPYVLHIGIRVGHSPIP